MKLDVPMRFGQQGLQNVEVIPVVVTRLSTVGEGNEFDPIRELTQYWTTDGNLIATVDPWEQERSK